MIFLLHVSIVLLFPGSTCHIGSPVCLMIFLLHVSIVLLLFPGSTCHIGSPVRLMIFLLHVALYISIVLLFPWLYLSYRVTGKPDEIPTPCCPVHLDSSSFPWPYLSYRVACIPDDLPTPCCPVHLDSSSSFPGFTCHIGSPVYLMIFLLHVALYISIVLLFPWLYLSYRVTGKPDEIPTPCCPVHLDSSSFPWPYLSYRVACIPDDLPTPCCPVHLDSSSSFPGFTCHIGSPVYLMIFLLHVALYISIVLLFPWLYLSYRVTGKPDEIPTPCCPVHLDSSSFPWPYLSYRVACIPDDLPTPCCPVHLDSSSSFPGFTCHIGSPVYLMIFLLHVALYISIVLLFPWLYLSYRVTGKPDEIPTPCRPVHLDSSSFPWPYLSYRVTCMPDDLPTPCRPVHLDSSSFSLALPLI